MNEPKYKMSINLQVLNHLGLNLYSNTSAVISEAVANAWDADATKVSIYIKDNYIKIIDNGNGMNLTDINKKYLTVGYQKRVDNSVSEKYKRPVMGRKGIGKLSLFSIAYNIQIYTKKDTDINGFEIKTKDLEEAIKLNSDYHPTELPTTNTGLTDNGTIIILSELKKKRTSTLAIYLKQRLARRFAVLGDSNQFNVFINDEKITIADRNYLLKAQCLWMYPDQNNVENYQENLLSQTKENILKMSKQRQTNISVDGCNYNVYGWIATCLEPKELDDDENINRIVIMVRGKMAKEDILAEIGTTSLYSKYVFGEINADFLDEDDQIDITTSSRQDFFEDDERYIALKDFIKGELSVIRTDWEALRSEKGIEEACKYTIVKRWYDELKGDDKTSAKRLFGRINQLTVDDLEKKELFKHGIMAFESYKLKNELSSLESVSLDNMASFLSVAGRLDMIEATMYYQIVQERLAVIQKMQEVVQQGDLERVVQIHLSKNMWLLDPSWDRGTELPIVEQSFKKQFQEIDAHLSAEELDARLDIRYKKTSNQHVIIELKRGDRIIRTYELVTQVQKYFSAMTKIVSTMQFPEPFEIIVLLGKHLDGDNYSEDVYRATIESLKSFRCRIIYYDELLHNAQNLYSNFLEKNKNLSTLSDLIRQLD
jgi:DNA mismatch repair enzyme (predicted ATPase)